MNYERACILSVGTAVPEEILTNHDLEKFLDTSDEWIMKRTGIKQRHVTPKDMSEPCTEFGAKAATQAIQNAGLKPSDVDCIILGTASPDYFFPSTACMIGNRIGCKNPFAFDFTSACCGFVYGLTLANSLIKSGQCKTAVVIGAEILSRTLDWTDRSTCILFGDGVGAVVLRGTNDPNRGILTCDVSTDGSLGKILYLPAWGEDRTIKMNGNEVFKYAIRLMTESTKKSLEACSMTSSAIDVFIPHQANIRIIQAIAKNLNIPMEKVATNIDKYGNTSSASIPLALADMWDLGKIQKDKIIALAALGGGVTVGSIIIRI